MILNHQNLPANHQILQTALQAAEQQLLIYFTDSSCSQSYLILECFYQNSFSYVIDCQFSHTETSCTVCRSCHPCCVVLTPVSFMFNYDFSVPEAKDAILAAVSHPTYKLKWVPPDNQWRVTIICWSCCHDRYSQYHCCGKYKQSADSRPGRWRWLWLWREQLPFIGTCVVYKPSKGRSYEPPVRCWQVTVQAALLSSWLRLFLKFNTALPSSAPVERLLSIVGLIEMSRRNTLSQ